MKDFITMFVMLSIAVFILNLISSMYPGESGKKTLTVAISIITLYLCALPFTNVTTYIDDTMNFIKNSDKDASNIAYKYSDQLTNAMESEMASEIEQYLKSDFDIDSTVEVTLSYGDEMTVETINIDLEDKELKNQVIGGSEIVNKIYEKYKVKPTFS